MYILFLLSSMLMAENAPQYKPETIEYKIQQIALNIEAVLPTKIVNPDYKDAYLDVANVPKSMRDNFVSRNNLYNEIYKMKLLNKAKELDTGYLEAVETASKEETDKIKRENDHRKELFALIGVHLNLKDKEKDRIPTIYAEVIKYLKDYSVSDSATPVARSQQNTNVLASMPSIYKYVTVWDGLIKVLEQENFTIDKKDKKAEKKGVINVKYKCGKEERSFVIKLCEIKDQKPVKCDNGVVKDDTLYSSLTEGTMIWVEKGKEKDKTLIIDDSSPDIKLCKGEERIFDVLEKLSTMLLNQTKKS